MSSNSKPESCVCRTTPWAWNKRRKRPENMLGPVLFSNSSNYSRTLPYIIKGRFPDYDIDEEKSLNNWSLQCSNSVKGANFIISTVSLKGKTIIQYDYFQNKKLKFKNWSKLRQIVHTNRKFGRKKFCGVFIMEYPCNPQTLFNIVFDTLITLYTLQREN